MVSYSNCALKNTLSEYTSHLLLVEFPVSSLLINNIISGILKAFISLTQFPKK